MNPSKLSLIALLPLALIGCAAPADHYAVRIEPGLLGRVAPELAQWSAHTDATFDTMTSSADCGTVHCFTVREVDTQAELSEGALGGACNGGGCTVRNPFDDSSEIRLWRGHWNRWTVLHEVGHALGLAHSGGYTVMQADYNIASPTITCADETAYVRARGRTHFCSEVTP